MIDAYAAAGTFADKHQRAVDLATAVMTVEQVPDIPMFRENTAAFVHDLAAGSLANVDGGRHRDLLRGSRVRSSGRAGARLRAERALMGKAGGSPAGRRHRVITHDRPGFGA
jgi:hypothetical protein